MFAEIIGIYLGMSILALILMSGTAFIIYIIIKGIKDIKQKKKPKKKDEKPKEIQIAKILKDDENDKVI